MTPPLEPIPCAALEMASTQDVLFPEAMLLLLDRLEWDRTCPVSGLFTAEQVRLYYANRGEEVNVVALPRVQTGTR